MGLSWGVFTTEKVMSRVGCLIYPGGCKRNGENGVQGGYMGLSWGVFTTEKVMSRVGCFICPAWGGVWWKWCPG